MPSAAPPPYLSGALILLIDDAEDNRDLYAQFLRFHGWGVTVAATGEEGLIRAAALKPAVIVLDLGLPRLDGWEVARRLKADPLTKDIAIIALTAHALDDARQRALAAGVNSFVTKPCTPSDLVEEIKRQLG